MGKDKKKAKEKSELTCEIKAIHGYLNKDHTKVVATVSWNGNNSALNIRGCFEKDGDLHLGKGVALNPDEVDSLSDILNTAKNGGELPKIAKDGRKTVDFNRIFDSADEIVEKREAGFTTEDGFIKLQRRPGVKLKK